MNMQLISVGKLLASTSNVRRQSGVSNDQLMASIASQGVLQNLVVKALKKPKGSFEVIAGGRRLEQVKRLIAAGTFHGDYQLNCLVLDPEADSTMISLNENFQREDMNPADEALAFKSLIDSGCEVETVSKSMGVTTRYVQGRLRLADLAPEIFAALAAGDITLDVAQAFGVRAEHDLQLAIYNQFTSYSWSPEQIRTRLSASGVRASSPNAILVGREAYLAAGGKIEADLFSRIEDELWTSPEILEPLVTAKLEKEAQRLAAEMNVGSVVIYPGGYVPYNATEDYQRYDVPTREPTDEETARLNELTEQIGEYDDYECADDKEFQEIEAKLEAWQSEIENLQAGLLIIPDEDRPNLVQFAHIGSNGQVQLSGRYMVARQARKTTSNGEKTANTTDNSAPVLRPISAKLTTALAEDRTDILRLYIASNPGVALNLLAFLLSDTHGYGVGFEVSAGGSFHGYYQDSRISPLNDLRESLSADWRKGTTVERFDKFMQLTDEDRITLLAAAVARSATAGSVVTPLQAHLAAILEIDVASQWRPTEENYWSQVPAARIHDAFDQIGGNELRNRYAGVKKGELAQAAETIFTGQSVSLEPALRETASTWVPEAMTFDAADGKSDNQPPALDDDELGDNDGDDMIDDTDGDADETYNPDDSEPDQSDQLVNQNIAA